MAPMSRLSKAKKPRKNRSGGGGNWVWLTVRENGDDVPTHTIHGTANTAEEKKPAVACGSGIFLEEVAEPPDQ
jgi:hypothetical protein